MTPSRRTPEEIDQAKREATRRNWEQAELEAREEAARKRSEEMQRRVRLDQQRDQQKRLW